MIPEIAEKPLQVVLPELLERFAMTGAEELGGFESYVYATTERVMKLTHTLRRSEDDLVAEARFTDFLASGGARVARPVRSVEGRWVEQLPDPDGGAWLASATTFLPGQSLEPHHLTPEVIAAWGQLTGRLHALSRQYEPDSARPTRRHWHEDPLLDLATLPGDLVAERAQGEALLARVRSWPRTPDTYGLIHSDLHEENVHWDGQGLWAFDFDDCERHHFLNDVAVIVHTLHDMAPEGEDNEAFVRRFLDVFLGAYRAEFPLPPLWHDRMDDLLRLRDLVLLGVVCELWSVGTPHEDLADEDHRRIFEGYAARVRTSTPRVKVDWSMFR
ncbi:phosphotransferase enzyme family protein [Deinococcus pimensis]|uniref:phosphotransferase enzyme family protein n=1 Tax=Deinococcus pimensis TaxID=309888 RepID=UPI0012F816FD|nr:phosphotransferase [Deinococcus pimensis]